MGKLEARPGDVQPDLDPVWITRVREKLVTWFSGAGRALPWRETRDPYHVLVSEMMLVQTTVAAVIPYYGRFLDAFPDVHALAAADEADVLKAWEGLGYYRRARQLHEAARTVVERHGGTFPDDPGEVRALPGVGRYIAGALLSFAFDRPEPIVEANTQRVLARWLALKSDLRSASSQARLWEAAGRLVPSDQPGQFNQAFMELGALVCSPRTPGCLVCPVASECQARRLGIQDQLPIVVPKAPPLEVVESCALVRRGPDYLVVRRGVGRLWEGFWEFPTVWVSGADPAGRDFGRNETVGLAEGVRRLTGRLVEIGPMMKSIRYSVTKHRVRLDAYESTLAKREEKRSAIVGSGTMEAEWVPLAGLTARTMSAPNRRLVAWLSRAES
ncbi:MAG: A/G-specific adenine glycosylase [Isosphaeraceae bacterium]